MLSAFTVHMTPPLTQNNTRTFLEVMNMFSILSVVMVSHTYAYVQTHPNMYIKYVLISVYQLYLNKA